MISEKIHRFLSRLCGCYRVPSRYFSLRHAFPPKTSPQKPVLDQLTSTQTLRTKSRPEKKANKISLLWFLSDWRDCNCSEVSVRITNFSFFPLRFSFSVSSRTRVFDYVCGIWTWWITSTKTSVREVEGWETVREVEAGESVGVVQVREAAGVVEV